LVIDVLLAYVFVFDIYQEQNICLNIKSRKRSDNDGNCFLENESEQYLHPLSRL